MEPKEWYKASELIKDLDIKERRTRELLNELEEKGVTKGKRYRKKIIKSEFVFINMDFFHFT